MFTTKHQYQPWVAIAVVVGMCSFSGWAQSPGYFSTLQTTSYTGIQTSPSSDWPLYVYGNYGHYGPGKGTLFLVRRGNTSGSSGGTAWTNNYADAALKVYNYRGNTYSAGIFANGNLSYNRTAAIVTGQTNGGLNSFLTYRDENGDYWAGYFGGDVQTTGDLYASSRAAVGADVNSNYRLYVYNGSSDYGAGKTAVYGYRAGNGGGPTYGGNAFTQANIDAAVKGYSAISNQYTAGVAAFAGLGSSTTKAAALVAAKSDGNYGAYLAYCDGEGLYWSGYFNEGVRAGGLTARADIVMGDTLNKRWIIHNRQHESGDYFMISPDTGNGNWAWGQYAVNISRTNGNMGLGKLPDASYKLDANGAIKCTKLVIDDWTLDQTPDYVFEEDYELRELPAVEDFIKKNKHLPDVPSAREMTKNGVDLAQMNMTLLKKVEELTLYAVAQNKRIAEQDAALRSLATKVERLEKKR